MKQTEEEYLRNGDEWRGEIPIIPLDPGADNIRVLRKLTQAHVNPDKIPKMKVKHAAWVFSQKVRLLCENLHVFQEIFKILNAEGTVALLTRKSGKSVGLNCEDDDSGECLQDLKSLFNLDYLDDSLPTTLNNAHSINSSISNFLQKLQSNGGWTIDDISKHSDAYVAGYINKKIKTNNCARCRTIIFAKEEDPNFHEIINCREYVKKQKLPYLT
ncbi:hypothetical protein ILUMI_18183, partial [Ignelater luminosus]